MNHLSFIMAYESGELETPEEFINGFAAMIADGTVWQLQGSYGRMASALIIEGYIDGNGNVLAYPEEN